MVTTERAELSADTDYVEQLQQAVEEAAAEQHGYAVMACVPDALPGEDSSDILDAAAGWLPEVIRSDDVPGRLGDDAIAVGLPGTDAAGAQVLAHRLQSELTLRSTRFRSASWDAAFACLPEQGLTADELLDAAIELARTRRRRLAD